MATVTPAVRLLLNCLLLATTAYAARNLPGGLASRRLLQSTETCPDSANLLSLVNAARAAHGGNHGGSGYGQNILVAWGPITDGGCSMAMQYWYNNEAGSYDYANPSFQADSGHFSQIVWLSTTQMGCAVAQCPGSSWYAGPTAGNWHFIVCDFDPSGNVDGEFAANVLPETTVSPP
ncbi:Protein PRY1 [Auxenochlorella protothecoides]|uniref:Protein PRY1 n=1 Tax=Auxenochlorella protothecoides TaxID=3075 RepID=A0A087SP32_AUXPR|nr:Protein PRY1 [Auxenochlorella protothecoides]KFM27486.1 Protein PRY1 [Auxenochlorella protothecoides]